MIKNKLKKIAKLATGLAAAAVEPWLFPVSVSLSDERIFAEASRINPIGRSFWHWILRSGPCISCSS
jgi:hypothetical protein